MKVTWKSDCFVSSLSCSISVSVFLFQNYVYEFSAPSHHFHYNKASAVSASARRVDGGTRTTDPRKRCGFQESTACNGRARESDCRSAGLGYDCCVFTCISYQCADNNNFAELGPMFLCVVPMKNKRRRRSSDFPRCFLARNINRVSVFAACVTVSCSAMGSCSTIRKVQCKCRGSCGHKSLKFRLISVSILAQAALAVLHFCTTVKTSNGTSSLQRWT